MPKRDEKRRQLILEALAPKAGADRNAVDHALWPWERLAVHLTPLIGDAGFAPCMDEPCGRQPRNLNGSLRAGLPGKPSTSAATSVLHFYRVTVNTILAMPDSPHDDDHPPVPPIRPGNDECCNSGCNPCILDLHEEAVERYRAELRAWEERRKGKKDINPSNSL